MGVVDDELCFLLKTVVAVLPVAVIPPGGHIAAELSGQIHIDVCCHANGEARCAAGYLDDIRVKTPPLGSPYQGAGGALADLHLVADGA